MRGARSDTGFTGGAFPGLVLLQGLVEGAEVYPSQKVADLARLFARRVEPVLYAGVDLPQKLDGLAQSVDQLLVGHLVQGVGELLELPDLGFQVFLFSPAVLHRQWTIHHPARAFGPPKTPPHHVLPARPGSRGTRSPRPPRARPRRARHPRPENRTRPSSRGKRQRRHPPPREVRCQAGRKAGSGDAYDSYLLRHPVDGFDQVVYHLFRGTVLLGPLLDEVFEEHGVYAPYGREDGVGLLDDIGVGDVALLDHLLDPPDVALHALEPAYYLAPGLPLQGPRSLPRSPISASGSPTTVASWKGMSPPGRCGTVSCPLPATTTTSPSRAASSACRMASRRSSSTRVREGSAPASTSLAILC